VIAGGAAGRSPASWWWNAATGEDLHGRHGRARCARRAHGGLAIATDTQLLLVVLGGLFVIETTSVVLQVISFRGFGKRIFRMSPIHHNFELAGWPEFTVIVRFWIVAGICVAVGSASSTTTSSRAGGSDEPRAFEGRRLVSSGLGVAGAVRRVSWPRRAPRSS